MIPTKACQQCVTFNPTTTADEAKNTNSGQYAACCSSVLDVYATQSVTTSGPSIQTNILGVHRVFRSSIYNYRESKIKLTVFLPSKVNVV